MSRVRSRGVAVAFAATLAAALLAGCMTHPALPLPAGSPTLRAGAGIAEVLTAQGPVLGYEQGGLRIFKGLPYARVQRFQAPQPVAAWTQPRSSRAFGPVCPQSSAGESFDMLAFIVQRDHGFQAEDCLNLNVWAPAPTTAAAPMPVMVWLHGGGYATGSSRIDGAGLARGDVVVVSVNHRLNVLGFTDLSLLGPGFADSGNLGLLDIVAALRWVQQNIAAFGGDPGNVTVFGTSGGGSKVADLLTLPAAAGLFHKAIVQSSFRERLFSPERSRRLTERWLARLQLDPAAATTAARLATWPHAELLAAMDAALADEQRAAVAAGEVFAPPVGLSYGPMHDGRWLPWQPGEPAAAALAARVPLIIGSTHHEFGAATRPPTLRGAGDEQIDAEGRRRHGARFAQVQAAHRAAHPGWPASDWLDTDVHFRQLAVTLAERHVAAGGTVWRYLFDWPSPVLDGFFKVGHGAELPFMFDETERRAEATGGGPVPRRLAAEVSAAWRAFARHGDPRAALPQWQPYTAAGGETLLIDLPLPLRRHPDRDWLCLHRPGCTLDRP